MKDSIYITISKNGITGYRKTIPSLRAGEYAVRIDLTVDDKYFKRVIPIAGVEINDKHLIEPKIVVEPIEQEEDLIKDNEEREVY